MRSDVLYAECQSPGCPRAIYGMRHAVLWAGWMELGGKWYCPRCCARMVEELDTEFERLWRKRTGSK